MFVYGEKETAYLAAQDAKLGAAMERIGHISRETETDLFASLTCQIIGQQISNAAYESVKGRLTARIGGITPDAVIALGADGLRSCGMSMRKAENILAAAKAFADGEIDVDALRCMPDDKVIAALTALGGVGVWTAQMLLIFCLERPDVLSYGDFGIRKGLMRLHGLETLTKAEFEVYRARYSPYGTVAGFYLWAIAAGEGL